MTTMHVDSDELYPYYFESAPGPWSRKVEVSDDMAAFIRESQARFEYMQSFLETRIEGRDGFIGEERAEDLARSRQKLIGLGITPPTEDDQQEVGS